MIFKNIFVTYLIYIISLLLISAFFIKNSSLAEDIKESVDPVIIWGEEEETETSESANKIDISINDEQKSNIAETEFEFSRNNAIGLYDLSNGGFDSDIWKNSSSEDIDYLLNKTPYKTSSSVLKDLMIRSILTTSNPPTKQNFEIITFLDMRINFLVKNGLFNEFYKLAILINEKEWNDNIKLNLKNYYLLYNYKFLCKKDSLLFPINEPYLTLYYDSFCNAMSSNKLALDLNIELMNDAGTYDKDYITILETILNNTQQNLAEIDSDLNLFHLNLLNKIQYPVEKLINESSPLEHKLFYLNNTKNSNLEKISIAEELFQMGTIDINALDYLYRNFNLDKIENKNFEEITELEKRVITYRKIRNLSSQSEIVELLPSFLKLFSNRGLLINSSELIYDKIKVITPRQDYIKNSSHVCKLLILNKDLSRCNEWLDKLDFSKNTNEAAKIRFYRSFISDEVLMENDLINIIENNKLSIKQKNVLVKYYEVKTSNKKIDYWKLPNQLDKISSVTTNIRLHEYIKSLENKIGEEILLLNLIQGDENFNDLDDYSLFLIIEKIANLNKNYLNQYVLEFFSNNNL